MVCHSQGCNIIMMHARKSALMVHRQSLILLCSVLGLVCVLIGCAREDLYKQQVSWDYVYEIGSARTIAEWTLVRLSHFFRELIR
jgi:hypothetical protein